MLEWEAEHVEGYVDDAVTRNCLPLLLFTVNILEIPRPNSYNFTFV